MSYLDAKPPRSADNPGLITLRIEPRERDLGGFTVRRVLPAARQRMVGPFIFFDHIGPAVFPPGEGIQVRPHPHIGLATVTYLFEGEIMHRDSLGFAQPIRPGAVNLMTAGRGIVHSERAGDDLQLTSRLHGIQSWMALPDDREETDPAFQHYPADSLPEVDIDGVRVRIIMGEIEGARSPVIQHSPTLYMETQLQAGDGLLVQAWAQQLAVYVVSGELECGSHRLAAGTMGVLDTQHLPATFQAVTDSRALIIGGASVGARHIWWNFVASSRERIEQAKADWRNGKFAKVPGDDEFIPLPDQ